ncbi:MAG: Asp23/Gls24 family envelope stress response protein, partial [Oscillospiraceae bacterium]|nr:Asp23/Gls24 family envelope stress response protein [Oscillospiraceae bacterium]
IAVTAAKEVEGVGRLVPRAADITRALHANDALKFVKISGSGEMVLHIALCIAPGARIANVAAGVQAAVKNAVQNMTGRTVSRVNITIAGIDAQ